MFYLTSNVIRDFEIFSNFNLLFFKIILPILISMIISFFIGLERQNIGKAAGVSSHVLVALSVTSIAIFQRLMYEFQIDYALNNVDIRPEGQRIIAQVLTGVGFLGAGVILKDKDNVIRGLTTAATIWSVALMGVILGSGYILLGTTLGLIMTTFIYIRDIKRGINPLIPIDKQEGINLDDHD